MIQIPNLLNLFTPYSLIVYMLVFTRISGMIISAPFFSTIQAPAMTKLWFCAAVAFILYPLVQANKSFILPKDMTELVILVLTEFFIGYLIGFCANLFLEGVRMTGNIISIQMGLSMSQALDPITGVDSPEVSRFYIYLATIIFLSTGAYQMLFICVFNSFSAIPMGLFPIFNSEIVSSLLHLFSQLFKIAFGLALPIFSVLLITDIMLGMMNKMMPQMNIYMVALPVKMYIAYFLIISFLSACAVFLQNVIKNYMQAINIIFT